MVLLIGLHYKFHQLGNCLLGRWWLEQGGGGGAPRWETPPGPSPGSQSGMNNDHCDGHWTGRKQSLAKDLSF